MSSYFLTCSKMAKTQSGAVDIRLKDGTCNVGTEF